MGLKGIEENVTAIPIDNAELSGKSREQQISEALLLQARQLMNIASIMRSDGLLANREVQGSFPVDPEVEGIFLFKDWKVEPNTRDMATAAYRVRRLRDSIFADDDLFGEPAWDILLDLANASASGVRVSVSSACIGACVPATTALRWLSLLESKGLVEREDDILDGRRTYVRLSRLGLSNMERYLRASHGLEMP